MLNRKDGWILVLFIAMGIVIGGFIGYYVATVPALAWLNFGKPFNFENSFDIVVMQLEFNLEFRVNIASIIGILLAILAYKKLK